MGAQITIAGGGAFTRTNIDNINDNFSTLFAGFTPGNIIYCNPSATGNANVQNGSAQHPYTDLVTAYGKTRNGMNDVVLLVGDGASGGSARISSTFTWSNSATHLFGVAAPTLFSQRARIAPPSGATAFANFFVVSGSGNVFQNIEFFQGFGTGTTAQICMTVTGSQNVFRYCHLAGMGDTTSATDAGSRNLKIGLAGSGENLFEDCVIGIDTVARTGHNASVEFTAHTPRNVFRRCIFPIDAGDSNPYFILGTGNACVDRGNAFEQCLMYNDTSSGATAITVAGSFSTAAPGGAIFIRDCALWGGNSSTNWGDTNFLANSYIDMAAPATSTGGLMVVPS